MSKPRHHTPAAPVSQMDMYRKVGDDRHARMRLFNEIRTEPPDAGRGSASHQQATRRVWVHGALRGDCVSNPFNRVKMTEGTWAVICLGRPMRDEDLPVGFDYTVDEGVDGVLATRSGFPTREDAVRYAATVNPSWRPLIAKLEAP